MSGRQAWPSMLRHHSPKRLVAAPRHTGRIQPEPLTLHHVNARTSEGTQLAGSARTDLGAFCESRLARRDRLVSQPRTTRYWC
jgi:hypothetical protein